MANFYGATSLIGSGTGAVDAIASAGLATGDAVYAVTSTTIYTLRYDSTSASAESSPDVIAPDDIGGGNGRWLLVEHRTATEDVTGIVELATDAETVTGTATDRVTTPANITARLAAPGAIGGTTPAAGNFTTLGASGNVTPDTLTANREVLSDGSKNLISPTATTVTTTYTPHSQLTSPSSPTTQPRRSLSHYSQQQPQERTRDTPSPTSVLLWSRLMAIRMRRWVDYRSST